MNRKGFTLIELLIVVVIIGILAAIAIPKFANTKEKAYIASMKADLRNLVTAEEAYFADSVKYTTTTSCANPPAAGAAAYCTTTGNTIGTITVGTGTQAGWTVNVTNINTPKSCAIYVGAVTPSAPATASSPEGAPVCL
jgi:type IV pilus assembly protein PilA